MTNDQQQKITEVLQASAYGVIATHGGEDTSESALITIAGIEELSIVVGSLKGSRKNSNIEKNKNISFVIGWDPVQKRTIQVEGTAVPTPHSDKYHNEAMEYFTIVPRWMRYSDFSAIPREVWEVNL